MKITAQLILASAPARFRPEKAQGLLKIFHFIIRGDEEFSWTLEIRNGVCLLHQALIGDANCTVTTTAKTYIELETGKANPQFALMTGKVKVSHLTEMMAFSKCFRKFDVSYINEERSSPVVSGRSKPERSGPLSGLTIMDFTRLLPGPMATMLLAGMGADVIKVEDQDAPDYVRTFEPMLGDQSAFYYALNTDKRSLAINFLKPQGREVLLKVLERCDVLVEQFRPGVMARFGLDYDTLKDLFPKLIYVSITGYGQQSVLAQAAGHDLNYIATSGLLGMNGTAERPVIPGFQVADVAGGAYMAMNAVLAALYQRERTGKGDFVDVAMTDAVLPLLALPFAAYQATGEISRRESFQLSGGLANYNVYICSDGKFLAIGALEPKFWSAICEKLQKPEWEDALLSGVDAHDQIKAALGQLLKEKTSAEWLAFFEGSDCCVSLVNDLSMLEHDPYLVGRDLFATFDLEGKAFKTIRQPLKFSSAKSGSPMIAPKLGEDTFALLREAGFTDAEIGEMNGKVIWCSN
ncbi:MAG: CoA transferase [Chitinophagales bacterium]